MSKKNEITPLSLKVNTLQRTFMWYFMSGLLDLVHVVEYPKSGGTWVSQMISEYLNLPFPRNETPRFEKCVMHGHYLHSNRFENVICVLRDGRDIMVSAYYHKLFYRNDGKNWIVDKHRKDMPFHDYDNIKKNLPLFIEFMFEEESKGLKHFSWSEFVNSWYNKETLIIKYENLLIDPLSEMNLALVNISDKEINKNKLKEVIDKFSFENQSKRKPGEEDTSSFLRKGISGDWKNKFNKKAKMTFQHFAGEELVISGYEKSKNFEHWN